MYPTAPIGYAPTAGTNTGYGTTGFGAGFVNYPLDGAQLVAAQTLSHQFDGLWNAIVNCIPAENSVLLGNIKTKLDEAYMFTGRAIAKPVVIGARAGAMSF